MALEIRNIEGVTCLKGTASSSHTPEVVNFFKTLLDIEKKVVVNICGVETGQDSLLQELKKIKNNLTEEQEFTVYGAATNDAVQLYKEINNPLNFYSAAA